MVVVLSAFLLEHDPGHKASSDLGVRAPGPTDIALIDLADVAVTATVTNHGTTPVTPTCEVRAFGATGGGARKVTLATPLEPGQTTTFTAKVRVSRQAAPFVTRATVTCS